MPDEHCVLSIVIKIDGKISLKEREALLHELEWGPSFTELHDRISELVLDKIELGKMEGVIDVEVR